MGRRLIYWAKAAYWAKPIMINPHGADAPRCNCWLGTNAPFGRTDERVACPVHGDHVNPVPLSDAEVEAITARQERRQTYRDATDSKLSPCESDVHQLLAEVSRQRAEIERLRLMKAFAPEPDPTTAIDSAWTAIARGWDIEPREYFEANYPGQFTSALAMAVHYMWKRNLKPADRSGVEALPGTYADKRGTYAETENRAGVEALIAKLQQLEADWRSEARIIAEGSRAYEHANSLNRCADELAAALKDK